MDVLVRRCCVCRMCTATFDTMRLAKYQGSSNAENPQRNSDSEAGRGVRLFFALTYAGLIVGGLLIAMRPEAASTRLYGLRICGGLEVVSGSIIAFDIGGVATRLRGTPNVRWIKIPFARSDWLRTDKSFRLHAAVSGAGFVAMGMFLGLVGLIS